MAKFDHFEVEMANRRITITPEALEECAKYGMKQSEVARLFGVSQQTISRAINKRDGREAWERGTATLERDLRHAQIDQAINGRDRTMLIWCGKQYLGQVDAPSTRHLEIDQRVSVRYIAEWGRDSNEIEAAANPMIEAGEDDVWEEDE